MTTLIYSRKHRFRGALSEAREQQWRDRQPGRPHQPDQLVPELNAISFSMYFLNTIALISYPEGELIAAFGGELSTFSNMSWDGQHGHDVHADHIDVFNNNGQRRRQRAPVPVRPPVDDGDGGARLQLGDGSPAFGDVKEQPNGNYFVTYSTSSVMHEIDPSLNLLREVETSVPIGYVRTPRVALRATSALRPVAGGASAPGGASSHVSGIDCPGRHSTTAIARAGGSQRARQDHRDGGTTAAASGRRTARPARRGRASTPRIAPRGAPLPRALHSLAMRSSPTPAPARRPRGSRPSSHRTVCRAAKPTRCERCPRWTTRMRSGADMAILGGSAAVGRSVERVCRAKTAHRSSKPGARSSPAVARSQTRLPRAAVERNRAAVERNRAAVERNRAAVERNRAAGGPSGSRSGVKPSRGRAAGSRSGAKPSRGGAAGGCSGAAGSCGGAARGCSGAKPSCGGARSSRGGAAGTCTGAGGSCGRPVGSCRRPVATWRRPDLRSWEEIVADQAASGFGVTA